MASINKLFNGRNNSINVVDDYGSMILGLKWKSSEEEPEPELSKPKTNREKSPLKREEFINETKNDEDDMNEQIF